MLGDRRRSPLPPVLHDRGAERVAHQLRRLAAGVHEARRPVIAVGVKLERIAFAAVDAAHDEVDALQTFERLQVYAVASGTHVAG